MNQKFAFHQAALSRLCLDFYESQYIYPYMGEVYKKICSRFDNIVNIICFIILDMIMYCSSLVSISATRITETIFETPNNQGKNHITPLHIHCTKNHIFFFQMFRKDRLSKKIALEHDLSCIIRKNVFSLKI